VFIENLVALAAIIAVQGRPSLRIFQTKLWSLQIIRVFFASAGILVWYTALFAMPMSQAIALSFIGPAITVIGAYLFLKEYLSLHRIFAIALSILGAFAIMRPDLTLMGGESLILSLGIVSFLPILSTLLFSGAKLTARAMATEGETATTMTTYIFMGLAPVSLLPAMISWQPLILQHIPFLFGMGLLASASHWMTAHSYTHAHINFLTPFSFTRLMAGTAIGWWVFEDHLSFGFWLGSGLIAFSVLLLAYDRKQRNIARPL
ncbi:MAG: DMT family transporter, partial [bacterium]|nr:DMT family transporter [bacterium]